MRDVRQFESSAYVDDRTSAVGWLVGYAAAAAAAWSTSVSDPAACRFRKSVHGRCQMILHGRNQSQLTVGRSVGRVERTS